MRRALDRLYDATGALAAFFVFAIFVVMIVTTVMRTLGMKTGGSDDVVSWLTAAAAFYALAHTFKHGDFVRVHLVLDRASPGVRRVMEAAALAVATAFAGYLCWAVTSYVVDSWRFGDMAGGLVVIPIWIPQSSLVVGSALLFLALADELIRVLRGASPSYVTAVEQRHARGDYREDI